MDLKPIEPGCQAVITRSAFGPNRGKPVLVSHAIDDPCKVPHPTQKGYYIDLTDVSTSERIWFVEGNRIYGKMNDTTVCQQWGFYAESALMRIDGFDLDQLHSINEDVLANSRIFATPAGIGICPMK